MRPEETLEEAIDRVASQMTQSGGADGVDIRPVWMNRPAHPRVGWRVAGVAGVGAVLLALAIIRAPGVEERATASAIGASPLIAWLPLRPSIFETRSRGEVSAPVRAIRMRGPVAADRQSAPTFGIPFLQTPTALAIAAPTRMSDIDVDAVAVDAIEVAPLLVGAIDPNGARDSKE